MDETYKDAKTFFSQPSYNTLVVIPVKDEIVPRKPLIELLEETKIKSYNFFSDFIIFESSYHMILRDMKGDNVTEEIKKWILEKKMKKKTNFNEVIQKLRNADYHHILD
jgi:esterase/lipase